MDFSQAKLFGPDSGRNLSIVTQRESGYEADGVAATGTSLKPVNGKVYNRGIRLASAMKHRTLSDEAQRVVSCHF